MSSIMDKYKSETPEQIGQQLKEQGVELDGDSKQSEVGKDNVNVAGGYENLNDTSQPTNEKLAQSMQNAQEQIKADPAIEKGMSQVQNQEEEQER